MTDNEQDKCPKCGAGVASGTRSASEIPDGGMVEYGCSTHFYKGESRLYEGRNCLRRQLAQRGRQLAEVKAENERMRAELEKWPRVYFHSADPSSAIEGKRVVSVSGKTTWKNGGSADGWLEVLIDDDGEVIYAPDDFGLYSTREAAEAAKEQENAD